MPSRLREKFFAKRMLCSGALRTGPEAGNHSSGDVDENRIHKIDTAEFSSKLFNFLQFFLLSLFSHFSSFAFSIFTHRLNPWAEILESYGNMDTE